MLTTLMKSSSTVHLFPFLMERELIFDRKRRFGLVDTHGIIRRRRNKRVMKVGSSLPMHARLHSLTCQDLGVSMLWLPGFLGPRSPTIRALSMSVSREMRGRYWKRAD